MPLNFIGCFVSLGAASFLFSLSFAQDLEDDIHSINQNARKKRTRKHSRKQLIEFIRLSDFKRFVFHLQLFRKEEKSKAFRIPPKVCELSTIQLKHIKKVSLDGRTYLRGEFWNRN